MAKLLVLYKKPKALKVSITITCQVYIPLANKISGLKNYDINAGAVGPPARCTPHRYVA